MVRNHTPKWFFKILSTSSWIIVFPTRFEKGYILHALCSSIGVGCFAKDVDEESPENETDDTSPHDRRLTDAGVSSSFFFTCRLIHICLHRSSTSPEVNPTAHIASGTIKPRAHLMILTAFLTCRSLGFLAVPSTSLLAMEWRPYVQY